MDMIAVMLAVGFGAMLAQAVYVRELYVAGSGNELTIGLLLGVWLGTVALGAVVGRGLAQSRKADRLPAAVIPGLVLLAAWGPVSVGLLRAARLLLGVGPGEFLPLGATAALTVGAVLPAGLAVGGAIPLACDVFARRGLPRAASRLYAAEATGTGLAGVLVTLVLAGRLNAWQIMSLAGGAWLAAAAVLAAAPSARRCLVLAMVLAAGGSLCPFLWNAIDLQTAAWRWRSPESDGLPAGDTWRLVATVETRHQNLALVEQSDQYTLYGNGLVLFSFPDPVAAEHGIHPIMAQYPAARRVLLLGGEPVGDLAELLKYPLERLVYVELDPGIGSLVRRVAPAAWAAVTRDPRVTVLYEDGPGFVRRAGARFDLVIVRAPAPVSGTANRCYTKEFYAAVKGRLAPGGVLWAGLETSERLGPDSLSVAASVHRALTDVFESVRVTGGSPLQFVAGSKDSPLTLDREVLYRRSVASGVVTRFFRPEYLRQADEYDPARVADVQRRLRDTPAPANTLFLPVACRQSLVLWSRFSGSGIEQALAALGRVRPRVLLGGAALLGVVAMLSCRLLRHGQPLAAMVVAGFSALTLELVLLYLIQGVQGYLYAQFGLLVALFMAGTVAGAWGVGRLDAGSSTLARWGAGGALFALAVLAAGVAAGGPRLASAPYPAAWVGLALMAAGVAAAVAFVAASRLLAAQGLTAGRAVALTAAADYGGAMLGALLSGVVLVPVVGVGGTCQALALLCAGTGVGLVVLNRR